MNLQEQTTEQLREFLAQVQAELANRNGKKAEIVELSYNQYKGSGKCWIARIDSATKKILSFLDADSKQPRDNYSGTKTFSVPLVEGQCYLLCDSGSKRSDDRRYRKVENGSLIAA